MKKNKFSTTVLSFLFLLVVVVNATDFSRSLNDNKKNIEKTGMVLIKGGTFEMGDTFAEGKNNELPVHTVMVSDFYMGKYEVTQKEWKQIMGKDNNPSERKGDMLPVEVVTWYDAVNFCNKKSETEKLKSCYTIDGRNVTCNFDASGYRLPTEAEWEYAAREGGKKVRFGNGKNIVDPAEINFESSLQYKKDYSIAGNFRKRIIEVGSFAPNSLGLYDMSGNVWEWVWDNYYIDYYKVSPIDNPKGSPNGSKGTLRGGSFDSLPQYQRVTYRYILGAGSSDGSLGFRYVRKK